MEFFLKIKNTVHGWSEETRKFLAMAIMGIGIIVFFSVWISSVSNGLVAIGPPPLSAPAAPAPVAEARPLSYPPSYPAAFLPPSSGSDETAGAVDAGAGSAPLFADQNVPSVPPAPSESASPDILPATAGQDQAPTPIQGVAETFGGVRQLFRTTDSSDTNTIESRARAAGSWLWGIGVKIILWAQNFLMWFGGALYQRVSTLIAS